MLMVIIEYEMNPGVDEEWFTADDVPGYTQQYHTDF